MTVIAQDDHLTAGAWAACDVTLKEIRRKLDTVNKNTPCSTLQISKLYIRLRLQTAFKTLVALLPDMKCSP